jgi:hypothetical protein
MIFKNWVGFGKLSMILKMVYTPCTPSQFEHLHLKNWRRLPKQLLNSQDLPGSGRSGLVRQLLNTALFQNCASVRALFDILLSFLKVENIKNKKVWVKKS